MKNKMLVIVIGFVLILSFFYVNITNYSLAAFSIEDTFSGSTEKVASAKESSQKIIATVLSIVRIIAAAIALIILMVIACKYMLASAGERADIKKYAINYVVGAFILFGASAIVAIIQSFIDEVM